VTADARGQAMIPVLLPQSTSMAPAQLRRVNRQRIAGNIGVSTVGFTRRASLRGAQSHRLSVGADRALTLTTVYAGHEEVHAIGGFGNALQLVRRTPIERARQHKERGAAVAQGRASGGSEAVELNPQPLPPGPPPEELGIDGVVSVLRIPGFERSPVAIATFERGDAVLLDLSADEPRIAGTIRGPVGEMQSVEGWAVGAARGTSMLFQTRRS
jgi:hypothetical protein